MTLARLAVLAALAGGCSSKPSQDRAAPATQPAEPAPAPRMRPVGMPAPAVIGPARIGDADAGAAVPSELPDCVVYAQLIDRLRICDRLGGARDDLTRAYLDLASAWANVPADRRDEVAAQCRTQADTLRSAAGAICGW